MAKGTYKYQPDYAVPPGSVLAEMLEAREMSHAEFARRCGRSAKLISEIVAGKAPVEPETALQFERVLGMDASVWLNIEAGYQLHLAKQGEDRALRERAEWARRFPVRDLIRLRYIEKPTNDVDAARKLLGLFGVGSIEAWHQRYGELGVAYRHSPSFTGSPEALAAWLRIGELLGEQQDCAEFNRSRFQRALQQIRGLTTLAPEEFAPGVRRLCNEAGVAWVLVPPLSGTPVSGAARWLTPRKALIQQSLRHKSDDHFWFTFFHEAAHITLHSKRDLFVDERDRDGDAREEEADAWGGGWLLLADEVQRLASLGRISRLAVAECAARQGIAPGIVVGRLQHEGVIDWSQLNGLKRRYELRHTGHGAFELVARRRAPQPAAPSSGVTRARRAERAGS